MYEVGTWEMIALLIRFKDETLALSFIIFISSVLMFRGKLLFKFSVDSRSSRSLADVR